VTAPYKGIRITIIVAVFSKPRGLRKNYRFLELKLQNIGSVFALLMSRPAVFSKPRGLRKNYRFLELKLQKA
jgi:hypothetical protein